MQTIFIILSHGSKIVFCTFYETFFPLKKCFLNSSETYLNVFGFENLFEKKLIFVERAALKSKSWVSQSSSPKWFWNSFLFLPVSGGFARECSSSSRSPASKSLWLNVCFATVYFNLQNNFRKKFCSQNNRLFEGRSGVCKKISHGLIITQHVTIYGLISH